MRSRGASSPISRSVSASPNNSDAGGKYTNSPRHNFHQREDGAESGRAGNWQHSDSKRSEQYRNSSPNRAWKSRSRSRGLGSQPSDVDANPEAPYASRSVSRSRSRSRSVCSESGTAPQRVTSEAQNDAAVDGEVAGVILTDVRDNYSPRSVSHTTHKTDLSNYCVAFGNTGFAATICLFVVIFVFVFSERLGHVQ